MNPKTTANEVVYQVIGWDKCFEGAKSKTYSNKSSCQMPTKHGLGYKRLIRRKNGPALFGAWCALVQVLSRHNKPRQGYCTDTGEIAGKPYNDSDLEMLTDIPAAIFSELFEVAANQDVGWLRILRGYCADTARIPQETIVPLDSDLDLDSDLNLNSTANAGKIVTSNSKESCPGHVPDTESPDPQFTRCWEAFEKYGVKKIALKYWRKYSKADRDKIEAAIPDYMEAIRAGRPRKQFEGWLNPEHRLWDMDWRKAAEVAREKNAPQKLVNTFHQKTKDKSLLAF